MKKERFYKYAENASTKSNFYKCHTGCVAVYAGHVIAEGSNSNKTHTLQNKYNKYRIMIIGKINNDGSCMCLDEQGNPLATYSLENLIKE